MDLDDLPQPEKVTTVHPDRLHTDGDNPNEQTDEMFDLLCRNMRKKGWLGNHIICDTDYLIADGEHRWRAAQEIGLEEVPVKVFDIDDTERRLWRQELNKISGEHDKRRDALEYEQLMDEGKNDEVLELTDAAGEDLDSIMAELRNEPDNLIYEYDEDHNVYFEDCIQGMQDRLDDNSVDLVFTSPPYNVSLESSHQYNENTDGEMYEDSMSEAEYRSFINNVFDELCRVVKPSGHIFWNVANDHSDGKVEPPWWMVEDMDLPLRSYIIWDKENTGVGSMNMREGRYLSTWEPIYHFSEDPGALNGRRNWSVWRARQACDESEHDTGQHPAAFSVELVTQAIQSASNPGDLVLDPFMGSGTTAVASIFNDRNYVGFELDEKGVYQPIVERRISEAKRSVQE